MTLLDTSILIGIYRRRASATGEQVAQMILQKQAYICGEVWVEYIGGFRSESRRKHFVEDISILPWLDTSRKAYQMAAELRASHARINTADSIIAATAITNGATLLTADRDFEVLSSYDVQVVKMG